MNKIVRNYLEMASEKNLRLNTLRAKEWFQKTVRSNSISSLQSVQEGYKAPRRIRPGMIITFSYSAKHKEVLPFWDKHPLVLVESITRDGWVGFNLHYMHPRARARMLYDYSRGIEMEDNEFLKASRKKYLASHVQIRAVEIPESDWDVVIQLPFENFQKQSQQAVWRDTSRKAR